MIIQIDSREKARAIETILREFDKQGVKHISSKLYAGDYIDMEHPLLIIDRKQNIREIASNVTSEHKRFKAELEKVKEIGAKMIILIEEDTIDGKPIESLEDIMLWEPKPGQGTVSGMRVYKILANWIRDYPLEVQFCNKRHTGKRIIEILGGSNE